MAETITVFELFTAITELMARNPEVATWPIHMMDLDSQDPSGDSQHGLVTTVETDCFDEGQGPVLSLIAERRSGGRDQ